MPLSDSAVYLTAAVSTVGVIGGAYNVYKRYRKNKRNKVPSEWVQVGHVKRLYVYPIKGCAPILVDKVECTPIGVRDGWLRDRVLMVLDTEDNTVVTAQTFPKMLKIQPSIKKAILTLEYPGAEPIEVNLAEVSLGVYEYIDKGDTVALFHNGVVILMNKIVHTKVYTSPVTGYDCGEEVNAWISKCLNIEDTTFRLVYYTSEKNRPLDGPISKWPNILDVLEKTDTGAFSDEISYHVINEASIEDLNSRLTDCQITDLFFRPNFLLSGGEAFDEDNWKFIKIGDNIFQVIKGCIRCAVTTMDPETGTHNKNMEPLVTLRRYRLVKDPETLKVAGNSPLMGIHMALRSKPGVGPISINDPFYVAY